MINPECTEFLDALRTRDFRRAKRLCAVRDVNAACAEGGWTALHVMVENYVVESVVFLLENGANPNQKDDSGGTPLHLALDVEMDSFSQIEPLLADTTLTRPADQQPRDEVTALLLRYGANPNAKTAKGQQPLDFVTPSRHPRAERLLRQYGALPSSDSR
jgi:ankyrin repeat protein